MEKLGEDEFLAFAGFEEHCEEIERARCIFKFALDHIPKERAEDLYGKFIAFEKPIGNKEDIEDVLVKKR